MPTPRQATSHLADLLRREHHALAEFLLALAAFDRERRWAELGYPSLFAFLNRELELSKAAAFYRLTAARLIQRHPEVIEPLRDGRLCYTAVVELSKVLTAENCQAVLPRFFHLSKREAADVRAELVPDPVVPRRVVVTTVRTSPAADAGAALPLAPAASARIAVDAGRQAVHPGEPEASRPTAAARTLPEPVLPALIVEPRTAELSRIHLTAPRRLLAKLAAARDALSHSHPGASEEEILEVGLDLILQRHAKRRGLVAKPRKSTGKPEAPALQASREEVSASPPSAPPASPTAKRSRHAPAHVEREVWERDQGRCQWVIDGGGICGETFQVQTDHIDGWALGADHDPKRMRLLCRVHQDVHARRLYGDALPSAAPPG